MKTLRSLFVSLLLCVLIAGAAWAQQAPGASAAGDGADEFPEPDEVLSLSEEMLQGAEELGTSRLTIDEPLHHYTENGYPETEDGRLVLGMHADGPTVSIRDDPPPYLLYAQYANRQRDAVFLARTGTIRDVLPTGAAVEIPFGYGAVKFNTVYVSLVESLLVPHFSDNQKEYEQFPLTDLYVGGGVGLTGIRSHVRYVYTERYVGEAAVGLNPFASPTAGGVLNRFIVPVHIGAGFRFPGPISILGDTNWTAGTDFMLGLGDRDGNPDTPSGVFAPGIFLDIERVLFDESGVRRDYRNDPRPYNYNVNALVVRIAGYANLTAITDGNWLYPEVSIRYLYNVAGPRIPDHEFKETEVLYVNEIYADDLREQAERRRERADR